MKRQNNSPILNAAVFAELRQVVILFPQIRDVSHRAVEQVFTQRVVFDVIHISVRVQVTTSEIVDAIDSRHSDILDASYKVFESNQITVDIIPSN